MKKLITTTIIGLGLFLGSTLFAQNDFASFYPVEDDDTPTYLQVDTKDIKAYQNLSKLTPDTNAFDAFYPIEDDDTPEY